MSLHLSHSPAATAGSTLFYGGANNSYTRSVERGTTGASHTAFDHPAPLPFDYDEAMMDLAVVRRQWIDKEAYYDGIDKARTERVALIVGLVLRQYLRCAYLVDWTLTYERSLHVRATLPDGQGSIQISVLLAPDADPADNTTVSWYRDRRYQGGKCGAIQQVLAEIIRKRLGALR